MKHPFPSIIRGVGLPRLSFPALVVALGLGITPPSRLWAQSDTLPLAANVDQLRLNVLGVQVPTSFAPVNSSLVRFFSGTTFKQVELKQNGQCVLFTDTAGRLRLPAPGSPAFLEVTLYDYVNGASSRSNLLAALRDQVQLGPGVNFQPARVLPGRLARLLLSDPSANGTNVLLAEGPVSASSSQQPIASFNLGLDAASALRGLQAQLPNAASHLSVQLVQDYEAQFREIDVQVNLNFMAESLSDLRQRVIPLPDGRQPHLLFAAQSPLQLAQSGSIDKETQFASLLRQYVRLDVIQRVGSRPNEALVERLMDEALKLVNLRVTIADQERQAGIGAFLLDDDIELTCALSQLRNVAASIRTDNERKWSTAFQKAVKWAGSTQIGGSVEAGIKLFSGKASAQVNNSWDNSIVVDRKREDFAKQLEDIAVTLEGDIPVLTGIRFGQDGRVSSINLASIENNLGSFTIGKSTLETELKLSDFVETLGLIPQVEALLVPRMEVGTVNSGLASAWPGRTGDVRYVEIPVAFSNAFAQPPVVIASVCGLGQNKDQMMDIRTVWNRVTTDAVNVQPNGFTLRIVVAGGWEGNYPRLTVTNVVASWTAVGQNALHPLGSGGGFASLGAPGAPPLIPGELRERVATPYLEGTPRLAGGRLAASFSTIPGRIYTLEQSTDLRTWRPAATTTAEGYEVALDWPATGAEPYGFFRVMTP